MPITKISVRGARQHNLKNINVEIPRNTLTVITGLSGSGKSSLAFDTIYAEGQRRYVETLSAYARQFLDQMERPDVDAIDGLSPSISIEQKTTSRSPRSTVGTITEIYDYLRLLFASIGVPHCPKCGRAIARQSAEQIVQRVMSLTPEDRVMVLAPIVRGRKGEFKKEMEKLVQHGFTRARIDGELVNLEDDIPLDKRKNHTIEVVIDRLLVKPGIEHRLELSVGLAMKLAGGLVQVAVVGGDEQLYSAKLACPDCGISVPQLEPRSFSFNSAYGACPECHGLGSRYEFDPARVITDWSKPLLDGGLGPGSASQNLIHQLQITAAAHGIRPGYAVREVSGEDPEPAAVRRGRQERKRSRQEPEDRLPRNSRLSQAGGGRVHVRHLSRISAGLHVGDEVSGLPGQAIAAGEPGGEGERHVDRRFHRAAGVARAGDGAQDQAQRARGHHRRTHRPRDRRAPAISGCGRTGLHLARAFGGNAFRRRRTAHPAGDADRIEAARRALRAGRAFHRIASSRQRPPAARRSKSCAIWATPCWWSSTMKKPSAARTT